MRKYIFLKAVVLLFLLVPCGAFAEKMNKEELNLELLEAVVKGDALKIRAILAKGANIETRGAYNYTPLLTAITRENVEIVKLLLDKGANPNNDDGDYTPLMLSFHIKEIVRALLDKGAKVNIQKKSGDGWNVLMMAAWGGYSEVVEMLLNKGAKVNVKNIEGWTPLMMAANNGHTEVVRALLGKGADVSLKNKKGETALMLAEKGGHSEIVQMIKEAETKKKGKK